MRHRLVSWAKRFLITMTFLGVTTANASDPELELPKVFLSGIAYDLAVIDPDLSATDNRQLTPLLRINDVLYTPSESANGWVFSEVVIDKGPASRITLEVRGEPVYVAEVPVIPAWVSVLPPLVAIGMALLIHSVLPALMLGLWLGAWALEGLSLKGLFIGLFTSCLLYTSPSPRD